MLNKFVIIYIEDILIYSSSLTEHKRHVTQVLQRLCTHHLYLELEKYEFHRSTIQFLGYILTPEAILMDLGKVDTVQNWPQPTTVKELQGFLGFANFYRRFITQYSQITAPLKSLLRHMSKILCPGHQRPLKLSSNSNHPFAPLLHSLIQIRTSLSWSRLMLPP